MFEYGTTREDFGAIAMAFREHAVRNPEAVMRKALTLDDYLAARLIVDPFGLYDCSLVSDGAGAVVVTSMERARSLKSRPVAIKGFGTFNNTKGWFLDDHMISTSAAESAQQAYRMAGLGPKDVDTAQIYDCFTYMVLTQLEDYGFCKKGEGGPFVESGAIGPGGSIPVNTSGGLLSCYHLGDLTGMAESIRQLRGEAGERQIKDCDVVLTTGHGGELISPGMCSIHTSTLLGRHQ
jgi:acetyl-CoA acetyltransferase